MIIATHRKEAVVTILIETTIQVISFRPISHINECFGQIFLEAFQQIGTAIFESEYCGTEWHSEI